MSVSMRCDKCRSEALKIGAKTTGKISIRIQIYISNRHLTMLCRAGSNFLKTLC
uniref:Heavy-metal-associated domain-containing protein n=1 Tax=Arabidopsis thaliana TaxID=3702 RepID=Q1PEB3_ARATH|nr:heavy-metal-associated domain-containing protein [Arabidopsis thaliana]